MRQILRFVMFAVIAQAAASQQVPNAGLEGVILRFETNERLSKATVELRGGPTTLTTTTESDGRFYFPALIPGAYRILVRRDGYWPAEFGQRWVDGPGQPITVAAGQRISNIPIVMTPGGVIAGRITNRFGQPLVGARVRAMKPWIQENQRILRVVQEVVANDLGEYRLVWLLPGRYYISATFMDWPAGAQLVVNPDAANTGPNASRSAARPVTSRPVGNGAAEDEASVPIYFPTTPDGERALAIDLQRGAEYRDVDINVMPTRTFHVRGTVLNAPPPPAAGAGPAAGPRGGGPGGFQNAVRLTPLTPNGSLYSTAIDANSGTFDFPKVVPGGYVAYLFIDGMTIRSSIDVRNGDVDGVLLPVTSGVNIPVRVSFEGEPPPKLPDLRSLTPTLWRDPTLLNAPSMPATASSSALQNIAPGDYRVYVTPILPPLNGANPVVFPPAWQNAYVKSIRLGDVDVLNGGLRFSTPPTEPLEIVVAANPGTLQGRVLNDRGEPMPSAVVTLFSELPAVRIFRTDMYKVTSTDTAGRFQVQGLPPGNYKVFAWENVENGAWMDPELLARYENWGQPVRIEEGKSLSVDLPIISLR